MVQVTSSTFATKLLKTAIQAKFDWVYYADSSYVRLSVIPDGESCKRISENRISLAAVCLHNCTL